MSLFLKGLIVGFCLAAPVGPIAALCVQRTISKNLTSGLVSGFGAAVADAFYGAVAAFGATIISEFLIAERSWMQRVGGVILIFMGLAPLPHEGHRGEETEANGKGLAGDFLSTFLLTLTNPMTFVAFAAVFTTMGIGAVRGRPILTAELVGGVLLGSELWWLILCGGAHALRHHFDFRKLTTMNKATGSSSSASASCISSSGPHVGARSTRPCRQRDPRLPRSRTPPLAPETPPLVARSGVRLRRSTPPRAPSRSRLPQRPLERRVDAERHRLLEARPPHGTRRVLGRLRGRRAAPS